MRFHPSDAAMAAQDVENYGTTQKASRLQDKAGELRQTDVLT